MQRRRGGGRDHDRCTDVPKAVEAAVRRSTSVKRIEIKGSHLKWTNVATAILKGTEQSKPLKKVELVIPRSSPLLRRWLMM